MNDFGLENLEVVERPIIPPGPRDILVRVGAVSLNYKDKLTIDGRLLPKSRLPAVPTSDAAGRVIAVGAETTRFKVGDRVAVQTIADWIDGAIPRVLHTRTVGISLPGTLATHIVVDETAAVAVPPSLDDVEASTLPTAALTAWSALVEDTRVPPGGMVLIEGTGGVSLFGLLFARAIGARPLVLAGDAERAERARALGAWRTIDRSAVPDWESAVREATDGRGVDVVLEVVGGGNVRRAIDATAAEGSLALVGIVDGAEMPLNVSAITRKRLTVRGVAVGSRAAFERMNRAIEAWGIKPPLDSVHTFAEARRGFARLDERPFGKVVIRAD